MANSLKSTNKVLEGEVLLPDGRVKYSDYMPERVKELCLLGLNNKEIASSIDISLDRFNVWRKEHPELREAMLNGRDRADAKVVGQLYQRALGVTVTEHKETTTENGSIVTVTRKQLPPDVGAASLILRNHQSGKFKDTKEITGKVTFAQMLDELESGGG